MSKTIIGLAAAAALALAGCAQPSSTAEEEIQPIDEAAIEETTDQEAAQQPAYDEPVQPAPRKTAQQPAPAPRQAASPPAPKPAPMQTVAQGTLIDVQLLNTLDSGESQVGDLFAVEVINPVRTSSGAVIPAGSRIHGTVQEVKRAKRGAGQASLTLGFDELELPDGYSTDLTASLSETSESKKKRNAAVIGGSAAGGALLGRIIGKDTKGAVIGGIVGGAIGTGVILSKEGEQVSLPEGTPLTIQLDAPVQVPGSA